MGLAASGRHKDKGKIEGIPVEVILPSSVHPCAYTVPILSVITTLAESLKDFWAILFFAHSIYEWQESSAFVFGTIKVSDHCTTCFQF
jgi:hypothetical protein